MRILQLISASCTGLSILTVATEHQYRGAGTMLTKWGTDLADKINAEVRFGCSNYIENAGRGLVTLTVGNFIVYDRVQHGGASSLRAARIYYETSLHT